MNPTVFLLKVERVEVKDVRVPEQLMRAMAAEAEAARNARAKVIAAEGEHKASRLEFVPKKNWDQNNYLLKICKHLPISTTEEGTRGVLGPP